MAPLLTRGRRPGARASSSPVIAPLLLAADRARPARRRPRQDAAVRQQERVPGGRRLPGRHDPRDDSPGALGDGAAAGACCPRSPAPRSTRARPRPTISTASSATTSCVARRSRATSRSRSRRKQERRRSSHAIARARAAAARRDRAPLRRAREGGRGPARAAGARRRSWRRSTGRTTPGRREVAAQVREVFSQHGRASWTWTGTSRARGTKAVFRLDREKAGLAGIREADVAATLRLALGRDAAGEIQLPEVRERVPLVVTLPPERRDDLAALSALHVAASDGRLVPLSEIGRFDRGARGDVDLPQEPETGRLRDRRRRRARGAPGVRDRGAREGASPRIRVPGGYRIATRTATAPFDTARYGDEVGRRVAHHLRGLPRSRPRLRRGAGADLRAGRGLVPQLHDPARDHGADSADADRHPAGARAVRRLLHGDLDDRLHRRRRDHRPQLDHPGRLHRAAPRARAWRSPRRCSTRARCASGRCC